MNTATAARLADGVTAAYVRELAATWRLPPATNAATSRTIGESADTLDEAQSRPREVHLGWTSVRAT